MKTALSVAVIISFSILVWWLGYFSGSIKMQGTQIRLFKATDNECELISVHLILPEYTAVVSSPNLNSLNGHSVSLAFFSNELEYQVVAKSSNCAQLVSEKRSAIQGLIYYETISSSNIEQYQR